MEYNEIEINSLAFEGYGVGRISGKACFVPLSVPGDVLQVRITKDEKRYSFAEIVKVLTPSKSRRKPECPLFGECGGCQWQHIGYQQQLDAKQSILRESLKRIGGLDMEIPPVIPSPCEFGYRNSARIHFSESGKYGFYRTGTREVIPVKSCPLLEDKLNVLLPEAAEAGLNLSPRPEGIDLYVTPEGDAKWSPVFNGLSELGFSQVNHKINMQIKKTILEKTLEYSALEKGVLDLYCGDGNLSFDLIPHTPFLKGYDSAEEAVDRAKNTLEDKKFTHASYECRSVTGIKESIRRTSGDYSCLILDPPRGGIKPVKDLIPDLKMQTVVYLSCIPPNLARDLKSFESSGYRIESLYLFDMFPQTYHLETLVFLRK